MLKNRNPGKSLLLIIALVNLTFIVQLAASVVVHG